MADKLELICAMVKFNGYSLEDIIEEADRKKKIIIRKSCKMKQLFFNDFPVNL